mmetsp:Transcript_41122/g.85860  ORF Transcript_41122/g.85860 Transcript_41122/m.85860 type:complete len:216 (-) Transcript_41122:178-825(-)
MPAYLSDAVPRDADAPNDVEATDKEIADGGNNSVNFPYDPPPSLGSRRRRSRCSPSSRWRSALLRTCHAGLTSCRDHHRLLLRPDSGPNCRPGSWVDSSLKSTSCSHPAVGAGYPLNGSEASTTTVEQPAGAARRSKHVARRVPDRQYKVSSTPWRRPLGTNVPTSGVAWRSRKHLRGEKRFRGRRSRRGGRRRGDAATRRRLPARAGFQEAERA